MFNISLLISVAKVQIICDFVRIFTENHYFCANIFALMPLFFSDSISRPAATAAPPIRSEVLMISTLMLSKCWYATSKQTKSALSD